MVFPGLGTKKLYVMFVVVSDSGTRKLCSDYPKSGDQNIMLVFPLDTGTTSPGRTEIHLPVMRKSGHHPLFLINYRWSVGTTKKYVFSLLEKTLKRRKN